MKQLLFTVSVLAALICGCGQQDKMNETQETAEATRVHNKEFGWTMNIPAGFDSMTTEEVRMMQGQGAEAMEQTHGMDIENTGASIFGFKHGKTTYFHSNWQPFDTTANYEEGSQMLNEMIYQTFQAKMRGATLDSSSTKETISGLEFLTFRVKVSMPDNSTMDCQYFRRLFGKKELIVSIASADREKHTEILEAWRKSEFEDRQPLTDNR